DRRAALLQSLRRGAPDAAPRAGDDGHAAREVIHDGVMYPGVYRQNYNPTGSVLLSTIIAAIPILVLLYFIAVHPHRDERGVRRLGIAAPFAAFYGVIAALLVACLVFKMPVASAISAFALGSLSGFLRLIWIV